MTMSPQFWDWINSSTDDDVGIASPKRGDAIFEGTDYPRTWDGFVGQEKAIEQLRVAVGSAKARGVRLDHTLIASGIAGVGKSTLATLVAAQMEAGLLQATGPMQVGEALQLLEACQDGDLLFIDEIHLLVAGNKNRADWILPYMTEGKLYTSGGARKMPDVTIIGATTDVGKLPQTLISRFMVQPTLEPYTDEEGAAIVTNLVERMAVEPVNAAACLSIATAADCNPRVMRQILTQVRDLFFAYPDTHPNLSKAFEWAGVSADGLTSISRQILMQLLMASNNTMSQDSIKATLGEPGPLHHHEQQLLRRGLIEVTPRGRTLTEPGSRRAREEISRLRAASA